MDAPADVDEGSFTTTKDKTPTASDGPRFPKTINVNVDYSSDRWVVVSYQDEKGDLFQGILLKANDTHGEGSPTKCETGMISQSFQQPELSRKSSDQGPTSASTVERPQSITSRVGIRSPTHFELDPHKIPSVAFRRTLMNGISGKDCFGFLSSRPALGIRRLENRSVRLRLQTSQRTSVLCAKCQEQRVPIPAARRNGNGNQSSFSPSPIANCTTPISSQKRRSADALDSSTSSPASTAQHVKKVKTRNGGSTTAAEAGQGTVAALPSASKIASSSNGDPVEQSPTVEATSPAGEALQSTPKVPKLKISFGNNAEKTTTIINLPPSHAKKRTDSGGDGAATKGGNAGVANDRPSSSTPVDACSEKGDESLPGGMRVGDIVWAKMSSSPYWPAQIFSVSGLSACVTWCGSKQYGFVDVKALELFQPMFRKRYNAKRTTGNYQKAVAEAIVKCSGSDDDSSETGAQSPYYRHLISAACWKYLTGTKSAMARSGASRNRGRSNNRRRKPSNFGTYGTRYYNGVDPETPASLSSFSSPFSSTVASPSIDWQPRVVIKALDTGAASQRLADDFASEHGETALDESRIAWRDTRFGDHNLQVSPLPVEKSEEDDDEDEDFHKLQIDESVTSDDRDDETASTSFMSASTASSKTGGDSFQFGDKVIRQHLVAGDAQGQNQGPRARVGENQDDFESALTELQEMNEMCAGTSVLARC